MSKRKSEATEELQQDDDKELNEEDFHKMCEVIETFLKKITTRCDKYFDSSLFEQKKIGENFIQINLIMKKKFDEQENVIKRLTQICSNAEETLTNVLVAIRQNEYLQAWHPAQSGYPEMRVVGKHPAEATRKI